MRRGVFSVLLGGGARQLEVDAETGDEAEQPGPSPITPTVFNGSPRYLQIQVEEDPPLAPPIEVGAVPQALSSVTTQKLVDPRNGTLHDLVQLESRFVVLAPNVTTQTIGKNVTVQGKLTVESLVLASGSPQDGDVLTWDAGAGSARWRAPAVLGYGIASTTDKHRATAPFPDIMATPTIGQGTEVLRLNYTPKRANSRLVVTASGFAGLSSGSAKYCVFALFRSDTNAVVGATLQRYPEDDTQSFTVSGVTTAPSSVGSPLMFSLRIGTNDPGSTGLTLNARGGQGSNPTGGLGTASTTVLQVLELAP